MGHHGEILLKGGLEAKISDLTVFFLEHSSGH